MNCSFYLGYYLLDVDELVRLLFGHDVDELVDWIGNTTSTFLFFFKKIVQKWTMKID